MLKLEMPPDIFFLPIRDNYPLQFLVFILRGSCHESAGYGMEKILGHHRHSFDAVFTLHCFTAR